MIAVPRIDARARTAEAARLAAHTLGPQLRATIKAIPAGAWRLVRAVAYWVAHHDDDDRREALKATISQLQSRDPEVQERRSKHHDQLSALEDRHVPTVLARLALVAVTPVFVASQVPVAVEVITAPGVAAVVGLCLLGVGWVGRNPDTPLGRARGPVPLTAVALRRALQHLGYPTLKKAIEANPASVRMIEDKTRVDGGYELVVELPEGVTVADVRSRRSTLARNLNRPTTCVFPSGDGGHDGILRLFVADEPLSQRAAVQWPLAEAGAVDWWEPFPIGVDPQGQPVTLKLDALRMVIGGLPDMGKSVTARNVALAAGLVESARVVIFDGKGSGDYSPVSPRAEVYSEVGEFVVALRSVLAGLKTTVANLNAREGLADSKLTRELVSPEFGGPVLLLMDEPQVAFSDPEHSGEISTLVHKILTDFRAAGASVVFATQEPNNDSIPAKSKRLCVVRLGHYVAEQRTNDTIFGDGAHREGRRTTDFDPNLDKGRALLVEGGTATEVQVAYLDNEAARRVAVRAQQARTAAGWVKTSADVAQDTDGFVSQLLDIWPSGQDGTPVRAVSYRLLAELLSERWPDIYPNQDRVRVLARAHDLGESRNGLDLKNGRRAYKSAGIKYPEAAAEAAG